jgi:hemerythrin
LSDEKAMEGFVMSLMTWKEEYSVGLSDIDKQHMKLIEMVNEVHEAMAVGKSKDVLDQVFRELVDYTKTHFTYEENLLIKMGYPGVSVHKAMHAELVGKVFNYKQRIDKGELGVSIDVMKFLRNWLNDHILIEDKKYGRFYSEKNMKAAG